MHILEKEQFEQWTNFNNNPCISIFMPTTRAGKDVLDGKDRIRLKTQWKKVMERLEKLNTDNEKMEEFNRPIEKLLEDHDFWRHQMEGLAIFVAKDHFQKFRVPIDFEPHSYISDHFYIKPMLPLLTDKDEFFLLALQIEKVTFFKAGKYSIDVIEIEELVPSKLEERVGFDHEARTQLRQSLGGGAAVVQGDDAANRDRKNEILRFFNAIDKGLHPILHDKKIPLVVACQDYLFPLYKEANSYQFLFSENIPGNPSDFQNTSDLHRSAWQLLEPFFDKQRREKIEQYDDLVPERKSADILEIMPAVFEGKVDTLFLQKNEEIWGNYNENMASVEVDETESPGNISLMNLAAIKVVQQDGTVYLSPPEDMPIRNTSINAIYRY